MKLQNVVSTVVDWRLANSLVDLGYAYAEAIKLSSQPYI